MEELVKCCECGKEFIRRQKQAVRCGHCRYERCKALNRKTYATRQAKKAGTTDRMQEKMLAFQTANMKVYKATPEQLAYYFKDVKPMEKPTGITLAWKLDVY